MIRILPVDKGDLEACDNLALASDELVLPHLKELLAWLQDMNWPVADKVSSRLSILGAELVPELRAILKSEDEVWKFWIVSRFLYQVSDDVFEALFFNLKKIQNKPTLAEKKEQVDIEVARLIRSRKANSHIISSADSMAAVVDIKNKLSKPSISSVSVKNNSVSVSEENIIIIDGYHFSTLEEFYDELESVFLIEGEWSRNLDGFHELLQNRLNGASRECVIRWENSALSKKRLGYNETIRQLDKRLARCHPLKKSIVKNAINKAKEKEGLTVYDWLVQIIQFHTVDGLNHQGRIRLELL
ncbi:MAG: DUF5071 domain-containing protein [Cellvibrionaceae bacterium]